MRPRPAPKGYTGRATAAKSKVGVGRAAAGALDGKTVGGLLALRLLAGGSPDLPFGAEPCRIKPEGLERLVQRLLAVVGFSANGRLDALGILFVGIQDSVQDPPGPDGTIVRIDNPLLAEPHLAPNARSVHSVSGEGEVFRAIVGPESQTPGQKLPGPGQDGQHLSGSLSIRNLIEALAGV